jgi:hypothetical protein
MFSVLFDASDRKMFGCALLKELDQWVDALQLLLYHEGWSRGVGQTSVSIEKVRRGVIFF